MQLYNIAIFILIVLGGCLLFEITVPWPTIRGMVRSGIATMQQTGGKKEKKETAKDYVRPKRSLSRLGNVGDTRKRFKSHLRPLWVGWFWACGSRIRFWLLSWQWVFISFLFGGPDSPYTGMTKPSMMSWKPPSV